MIQAAVMPRQPVMVGKPGALPPGIVTQPGFDSPTLPMVPEDNIRTTTVTTPEPTPTTGQPFGLGGAEMALGAGLESALNILNMGVPDLGQATVGQAPMTGSVNLGAAPTANLSNAVNNLSGFDPGISNIEQFTGAGAKAQQLQAALIGALGPEAQAAAMQQYQESPALAYMQEQAERAVTRNAAATGGTQGGNVLKELQRQAIGLSQQDFNQRIAQLGDLSRMGLESATRGGSLRGRQAELGSEFMAREALSNQDMAGRYGLTQGQMDLQTNLANQAMEGRFGELNAQLQQQRDLAEAQIGADMARLGAGMTTDIMGQTAGYRYGTGERIANQADRTYSALSQLSNELGINLGNLVGEGGRNIANLQQMTGGMFAEMPRSLQTLLANLAVQQGTNQARFISGAGMAEGQGVQGRYDAMTNMTGTLADIVAEYIRNG